MLYLNSLLVFSHLALGAIAVVAGAIALAARKGGAQHIKLGRIFAYTMGFSSLLGAFLGLLNIESLYITFHAGILGCTLIASSWLTVKSGSQKLGWSTGIVGLINILNTAALFTLGYLALASPNTTFLSFHASDYFFLGSMAGLAAIGDVTLLFHKTLSVRYRISRHLWRMCLAFFIAAGSAFTGPGTKAFPDVVRNSGVLAIPELLIVTLMIFWLLRTFFWTYREHE